MIPLLLLLLLDPSICEPQKDPRGDDLLKADADFGTPEHDNRVHTEMTKLTSHQIAQLMGADYFTNSTLPCDNSTAPGRWNVYCGGRLLQAVMAVRLFSDSKTFVDRPMKENVTGEAVSDEFNARFPGPIEEIRKEELAEFVEEFFDKEGNELDVCELPDWTPSPHHLTQIPDPTYQAFAQRLHFIWIQLCRKMKPEVQKTPERYSLLYIPHQFIIPGGRFREFYYWDAYWIIKGLLGSKLHSTARNMIRNFAHIIDEYGFIPNGGRVYYLRRSQPPFFAPMVYEYYQATQDVQFVHDMIPAIEKEYTFWSQRRTVNVSQDEVMFQYRTEAETPRPESFREDVLSAASAEGVKTEDERRKFFQNVGSAAESGWDFSSRWFRNASQLSTIETTNIVPVDLNAFICYNMNILQFFYKLTGNPLKQLEWSARFRNFRQAFTKVFYVPARKGWYDYNVRTRSHNTEFFASNAAPLFAQCYDPLDSQLAVDVFNQMEKSGAFDLPGGVPTSLHKNTSQQWDYPNGWSPLNHMLIEGLRKSISPRLQQKAFTLARKWLETNVKTFDASNAMWEKYDVAEPDAKLATGGEYEVQAGFGWTNGAVLDLIMSYSDRLRYDGPRLEGLLGAESSSTSSTSSTSNTVTSTTTQIASSARSLVNFASVLMIFVLFCNF